MKAYNNELENKWEVIDLVKNLQNIANKDRDERFLKEKSKLSPLPSEKLIDKFLKLPGRRKVDEMCLITFDKCHYMISPRYVGEYVNVSVNDSHIIANSMARK